MGAFATSPGDVVL